MQQPEPVIRAQQQTPLQGTDKYCEPSQLFQQLMQRNSHEVLGPACVKMENSSLNILENGHQIGQEMKPFQMLLQSNSTSQIPHQSIFQQQQQPALPHTQMQGSPVLQTSPPGGTTNTLENARISFQKQNQNVHRQYLQRRQQRHIKQSLPLQVGSSRLSSVPPTPVNTPILQSSFLGASPTLRDMLQSPATTLSSPTSPLSCSSPVTAHSPLPLNPQSPNLPTMSMEEHPLFPLNQNPVVQTQGVNSPRQCSPSYLVPSGVSSVNSQLSSSAPAHTFMDQKLWARREPRKHLLSTGSLAEEQHGGSTCSE